MRFSQLCLVAFLVACPILGQADTARCAAIKSKYSLPQPIAPFNQTEVRLVRNQIDSVINLPGGRSQVGWLDFNRLKDEVSQLAFCLNESDQPLIGSGSRPGSVYFVEEKVIVLNTIELWRREGTFGGSLTVLHEILGALGYPDENYEIFTYLLLTRTPIGIEPSTIESVNRDLELHLRDNSRRLVTPVYRETEGGGISGVGGGGEPEVISLKMLAYNILLNNRDYFAHFIPDNHSVDEVATYLFRLKIESDSARQFLFKVNGLSPYFFMGLDETNGYAPFLIVKSGEWTRINELGATRDEEQKDYMIALLHEVCSLFRSEQTRLRLRAQ